MTAQHSIAGKIGGRRLVEVHGSDHMAQIGKCGGRSLAASVAGTDYYQQRGKEGGSRPKRRKTLAELQECLERKLAQWDRSQATLWWRDRRLLRDQIKHYRRKIAEATNPKIGRR